ncbi:hypothetical protein K1T71_001167 [Dendrolimus kikuchii]|uniref:Uncharacterized protein n=1 Tax=Dendrolimus kikuchii TaxID=765133 RepID=A0ACC1DH15_9NEOP|nr:hypothetical protein K1T71_001167 [Dendrolimus kikuchii]
MLNEKVFFCVVLVLAWHEVQAASLPFVPYRIADMNELNPNDIMVPSIIMRARVGEGVPPPLCAGRCVSPPTGPVCAFDAAGVARTFATLCELEAVSCRESTYYAITSLGEC